LPVVGSFLVWGPAAVYLFVNGQAALAGGLFLWGAIVVGVSDDYLRPIVVDRYARINPSVIIIGVLGGIYAIGFMGLFVGPIIVGALKASLEVFDEQYDRL
jgi:predicted PurR-regulated permease PerM